ncbi:MAG TPA: hypothetical protein VES36_04345 [Candidatus Limnocylindrales bacterium]|nr:hypothetical protein [Candidatus Limnocylindrales bacterium]
MKPNRSVLYIGAGVLGLVVLGAAVVLLAEGRQPASFEAGTPQAAMQDYLAAWRDDDHEAAYASFSDEIRADTSLAQYESQVRSFGDSSFGGSDTAVYIDRADGDDSRVTLYLTIEQYYGGGLGGESYRSQREVRMVHQPDGWRIDQPLIGLEPIRFDEPPFEQPL